MSNTAVQQQNAVATQQQQMQMAQAAGGGIQITPKFVFGMKGDVQGNVFFLEDQRVIYPAGHNVVIYNIDEKTQTYIPGVEGSEGITAIGLSPSKKHIAICERADRAICLIWDISGLSQNPPVAPKRKKVLSSSDYTGKEFISVCFAPSAEKSLLATLTGENCYKVILWNWDKQKCFSFQSVCQAENMKPLQVSFNINDHNIVVVTGDNTYKFFRVQENNSLKQTHGSIAKKEPHISNNFTCHAWMPDNRLIVCTDQGEIMLLEGNGDYKMLLGESPGENFFIESIIIYNKGFIIGGENGQIMIYEKSEEPKNPYHRIATLPTSTEAKSDKDYPLLMAGVMSSKVRWMSLNGNEDSLVFTTENNQLMRVPINIERPTDDAKYEYLIYPFHSRGINGMDVCIKKQLVGTCGADKTVRIWNYHTKTLEICEVFQDEANSLAFHPSGFHIVVGFTDKVRMMNVFQKSLKQFKEIGIKLCREIRFSNGGHLFACTNQHAISVHKFYTAECPPEYTFKDHSGKVRCIQWLDDDSGFISGGWDGAVCQWNLHPKQGDPKDGQEKESNPQYKLSLKNVNFSCVANKPDNKNIFYAVGTDKSIKEIENGKDKLRYEAGVNISQLVTMHGARAFFAGVAEDDKPGSIQVLRYPWEKVFEVQAHSLPVERLRISFDNQTLFSSGHDGVLCIFDIKDKDPKGKVRENIQIHLSDELLIPKAERDKYIADIDHLKSSIQKLKDENEARMKHTLFTREEEIKRIESDIEAKKIDFENRKAALENAKRESERVYNDKLRKMRGDHEAELARREQDYADKQEADNQRYQELYNQKQEEAEKFEQRLHDLLTQHKKILKDLETENALELQQQERETASLREACQKLMTEHKDEREQIENQAWEDIDRIKEKNKEELAKIIDAGMQSKAELTLMTNDYKKAKSKKEETQKDIHEQQQKLTDLIQQTNSLRQQINSQKSEILERETTIRDKDKRIYDLKKKTQELEKFKFVLDYKIKELKRDIGPREVEIQRLNEQTNKMRQELKHFNRVNNNLALIVDDLRMRQEGLTNEVTHLREQLDDQEGFKKKFKDDVFECLHHIADFKKLKKGVIRLHKKYVKEEVKNEQGDTDLHREYANKRKYLENNVSYLRQMLTKDQDVHKQENSRIMKENVMLLQEINVLRKDVHELNKKIRLINLLGGSKGGDINSTQRSQQQNEMSLGGSAQKEPMNEIHRELKLQDIQIGELQRQIQELEEQNEMLRTQRPRVGKLPPIEHNNQQQQQHHHQQHMDEPGEEMDDGGQQEQDFDENESPMRGEVEGEQFEGEMGEGESPDQQLQDDEMSPSPQRMEDEEEEESPEREN